MNEDYTSLIGALKTYLAHHGRGISLVHLFETIEAIRSTAPPEQGDSPQPGSATPLSPEDGPPPYTDEGPPDDGDPPPFEEPPGLAEEVDFGFSADVTPAAPRETDPTRPDVSSLDMTNMTMEALHDLWKECRACKLGPTRKNLVFGEGAVPARIFFIGEGPGANEDEKGRPFVGVAGQLLDRMIEAMGLSRDQVYIGNIVKCRPPGNRDPETDEMLTCMPVLLRQIELVRPEVIVALGRISAQSLLATTRSLSKLRGSWHDYQGIPLLATYHPAYLLRNPASKKSAWEDLQMVMKRLDLGGE